MSIGLRIKDLRKDIGLSQKALAEAASIDNSQLSKIEKGKLLPTLQQVMDISSILKTSTDFLLFGENKALNLIDQDPVAKRLKIDRTLSEYLLLVEDYKQQSDEQIRLLKKTISLLEKEIIRLDNENEQLKKAQMPASGYRNVAEPDS